MIIKSITVEGFKSIYKETTINFDKEGLWKIIGDVGVGKTTLGECILFCLYGSVKDKKLLDLVSWGARRCKTTIELESRGHNIIINRLIRLKGLCEMEIFIDGKLLEYTNKRGGQAILEEEYFDVSRTAVETLCIISFNNFKSIVHLSSGSQEMRRFIDDVFGFNIVNKYIERCKEHLSLSIDKYDNLKTTISTLESQKDKYILQQQSINEDIHCDEVEKINTEIKQQREILNNEIEDYNKLYSTYNKQSEDLKKDLITIKEKGKQVRSTIDKLKNGICPLCGGRVESSYIEQYEKERETLLEQYTEKETKYNNIKEEELQCTRNHNIKIEKIKEKLHSLNEELSKIEFQKKLLNNNYESLIDEIIRDIDTKNNELLLCDSDKSKWQELYDKLYRDSRPVLLRHYVPALNSNINYYLREMNQPYVVTFDETLSCRISAFGIDDIPVSNLSTGQSKLMDTATILGIIKTLLSGVNFNIFFLDELLSNCHAELRDNLCLMLKNNISEGKIIYIITHADIDDSIFDGIIKTKLTHWDDEEGHLIQNTEYIIKKC